MDPRPTHALVRPPGASFARALSSTNQRIDVQLAQAQHAEYRQALEAAGLALQVLLPDERYPDGCFVEDTAILLGTHAVICRPGAVSRRGEEEAVAEALGHSFRLTRIIAPATLDGGDVLVLPDRVLVGRTARSNAAGIAQLAVALAEASSDPDAAPAGSTRPLPVYQVPVSGYLHLQSAVTYVGQGILLAVEALAGHPLLRGFDVLPVPPEESYAANALGIGSHVILPAGYPHTAQRLRSRGFTVLPVPMSEFAKADGGVTCLSLTW